MLEIKQIFDTEDLGKYIVIVSNKDHSHATKKIGELLAYLYKKKDTLSTMKPSKVHFIPRNERWTANYQIVERPSSSIIIKT